MLSEGCKSWWFSVPVDWRPGPCMHKKLPSHQRNWNSHIATDRIWTLILIIKSITQNQLNYVHTDMRNLILDPQILGSSWSITYFPSFNSSNFCIHHYLPIRKFMQAQSLVAPIAYVSLAALILHISISWLLRYKIGLGLLGVEV